MGDLKYKTKVNEIFISLSTKRISLRSRNFKVKDEFHSSHFSYSTSIVVRMETTQTFTGLQLKYL